jgi:betaine-homocysteine S-methyltransferase
VVNIQIKGLVFAVGVNCYFDPAMSLKTLKLMREGLEKANLWNKPTYLMSQPVGFHVPDAKIYGYEGLPEFPFCLEPRKALFVKM